MMLVRSGPVDAYPFAVRFAEVLTLVVLPDARGCGTRLLDAVDDELPGGSRGQTFAVTASNAAAQRLCERRGFVPAGSSRSGPASRATPDRHR